jgi:hypothetical protein
VTPEHALTEHASWILIHQRLRPVLAHFGTAAMSDQSPLCGEQQTSTTRGLRSTRISIV